MLRWLVAVVTALFLTGCASLDSHDVRSATADILSRTATALRTIGGSDPERYRAELTELLEQPNIDPLTRYLEQHGNDADRTPVLARVRAEQEKRCQRVNDRFTREKPTSERAERFRAGYLYSCPEQVSAYQEALEKTQRSDREPVEDSAPARRPTPATATEMDTASNGLNRSDEQRSPNASNGTQQQSDCYLLTTIRNFSAARNACEGPARAGDARAQTNMAVIERAFENYPSAHQWAQMAADTSADACFLLGQMHESGQGVPVSAERAVSWYTKAVDLGHADAPAALERLLETTSGEPAP